MEFVVHLPCRWERANQLRVLLRLRVDGNGSLRSRDIQLLCSRHRQYGAPNVIREPNLKAKIFAPAIGGRNQVLLCDDRARRGLFRRHQYPNLDHETRGGGLLD